MAGRNSNRIQRFTALLNDNYNRMKVQAFLEVFAFKSNNVPTFFYGVLSRQRKKMYNSHPANQRLLRSIK